MKWGKVSSFHLLDPSDQPVQQPYLLNLDIYKHYKKWEALQ